MLRFALDSGISKHGADLLTLGIGIGGLSRVFVAALSDCFGVERIFIGILVLLTVANATYPVLVASPVGGFIYAVAIGCGTGGLTALVLPLSMAALKPPRGVAASAAIDSSQIASHVRRRSFLAVGLGVDAPTNE